MTSSSLFAVLVAAGQGQRLKQNRPKAYQTIAGLSLLEHSVRALCQADILRPERIQIVIDATHQASFAELKHLPEGLRPVCFGGASRTQSVRNGLRALSLDEEDRVLIHDAARPFVSEGLLRRITAALDNYPAVIPILPLADALKQHESLADTPRDHYCLAQTPQGFHYSSLRTAENHAPDHDYGDEAAWVAAADVRLHPVPGEAQNFKITYPDDLIRARSLLSETVYGTGFDLHRMDTTTTNADQYIAVGGVMLPHKYHLIGHSDSDVVLHALIDAMLGTISGGDIGQHFPPSNPRWHNQDSRLFVDHALKMLDQAESRLLHLDITIIVDAPKIAPHHMEIQQQLSEILNLAPTQISVKATTTEGLGFIDAHEAIAAQVMVSVERPKQRDHDD
ncbi:MAG: 2-C-methyl-D-erythritol 2,4-cyclodiphosphate synthase [Alphaproteobacteria bacterium]|nr:2-C-methyl-D-erythritol 2,4-cyclodiphosphate synthase [Alphaproteobacteria bacterium]